MDQSLFVIAGAILLGALVILFVLALHGFVKRLRESKDIPIGMLQMLDALEPYLYQAIFAGERAVLWGFEAIDEKLDSMDKKAVADALYSLLPDVIIMQGKPIPISVVKSFVPREVFAERVKDLYDAVDSFIERNKDYLKSQVYTLNAKA